jgi:hypothetical protein
LAHILFRRNNQENDMAPRVKKQHAVPQHANIARRGGRILLEGIIAVAIICIFLLKIFAYAYPSALSPSSVVRLVSLAYHNSASFVDNLPFLNSCPRELRMSDVSGGYVCVSDSANGNYGAIFRSYPLVGKGIESIYARESRGRRKAADDLLRNEFDISRYSPVKLTGLPTWSENPYSASYWRYQFYSLQPTLDLLYAFRTSGKSLYAQKLIKLDLSFVSAESGSRWAWSDPHAVAYRSMTLVDTWWKLRQAHQLAQSSSTAILGELEKTGQYLADPNHYQTENNNCISEAAALYELAVAFPTLPNSHSWLTISTQRLHWQLDGLIDANGQLVQNSPSYDINALTQYWQIFKYSVAHDAPVSSDFGAKIQAMVNFVTYILQPNSEIPLLGSSVELAVEKRGVFSKMASSYPQLLYVLTRGSQGIQPADRSVYFSTSGLTIMRSGWNDASQFSDSSYLTYNIGHYRTAYSDLGALGITLYGAGGELLPGGGLYTYQSGPYRRYFHGTASQNTVVVDGRSQAQGNGSGTKLVTSDGMTYQSAESSLYNGVTHRRMVMMIDVNHVLVVDRLNSTSAHTYQQMFHLFPGAQLKRTGLTVSGIGGTPRRQVTIQQLLPDGITESNVINRRGSKPAGVCSEEYGKLLPCYQVSYSAHARNATFVTLLTIGHPQQPGFKVAVSAHGQRLQIVEGVRRVDVSLGDSIARPAQARATDPTPPVVKTTQVDGSLIRSNWTATGSARLSFGRARTDQDRMTVSLSTNSGSLSYIENDGIRLDLKKHNARIRIKVNGYGRLSALRLVASNDNWTSSATMSLFQAYRQTNEGSWVNIFVGPSGQMGPFGGWRTSRPSFNWANIDGIRIVMSGRVSGAKPSTVSIDSLSLMPTQTEAKLAFVFDDGYQSILPAAEYMHRKGMRGNVAVIGKYVDYPTQNHLNLYQLQSLQNSWGWDMVNHTQQHADAIITYADQNNLTGYMSEILQQASWLEANGLNSAPNWFIYPHGATSATLERVVGRYYMFARIVADNPDAYPYGDPLAIRDFEVQYPGDGGDSGSPGLTYPSTILSAVRQAIANNLTLILTFHRIHTSRTDPSGYPLRQFKKIVDEVQQSGIKVTTLSQLDQSNGVSVNNRIYYQPAQPSQITVSITG